MNNIELKHTLEVDRNSWFIRFYVWLWEAETSDVNFCKLFWGLSLAPIGLLVRGVFELGGWLLGPLVRRAEARREQRIMEQIRIKAHASWPEETEKKKKKRPRMQRVLERIEHMAVIVGMVIRAVFGFLSGSPRVNVAFFYVVNAIGLLIAASIGGAVAYFIATNISIAAIVLGILAASVVGLAFIFLLKILGFFDVMLDKVLRPSGRGIKAGAVGFRGTMRIGYVAVKSNTCPRIQFKGEEVGQQADAQTVPAA